MSSTRLHLMLALAVICSAACGDERRAPAPTWEQEDDQGVVEWNFDPPAFEVDCSGGDLTLCPDEQPDDPNGEPPAEDEIVGNWLLQSAVNGGIDLEWTVLEPDGQLRFLSEKVVYNSPTRLVVEAEGRGEWERVDSNTVAFWYALETSEGVEERYERHTSTIVDFALFQRLGSTPWWRETTNERIWTFAAYLPLDDSHRRYRREHFEKTSVEGSPDRTRGFATELTFDPPVTELEVSGPCQLTLDITLEGTDFEAVLHEREESFQLDCELSIDEASGLGHITFDGRNSSPSAWDEYLSEYPWYEEYPGIALSMLRRSFRLLIQVDLDAPDVLFHGLDRCLVDTLYTPDEYSSTL